jgi:nitroreductase
MEIIEAIHSRRSIRSFKPDPVPKNVLEEILSICRWTASGGNSQPWYFAVLGGEVFDEIKRRHVEKIKTNWDGKTWINIHPDIPGKKAYPTSLMSRVHAFRDSMFSIILSLGENIEDKKAELRAANQRFRDAPRQTDDDTKDSY